MTEVHRMRDGGAGAPWVIDLDGVMWLGGEPIPGSVDAVARLQAADRVVVFATNFSYAPVAVTEGRLRRIGVEATGAVVTSAMAAASLVAAEERVLVCGGPGIVEAVRARGAQVVESSADVVVVGYDPDFDYARLAAATREVLQGARLIGTNDDPTLPTPAGPMPGGGSMLAAVAYASGRTAVVAGKPHPPMAELVRARVGSSGVVVGDRCDTDGGFARTLGFDFGLVLSGSTSSWPTDDDVPVSVVATDLAELVDSVLGV